MAGLRTQQIMVFGRAQNELAAGECGAGDLLDYGALVGGDQGAKGAAGQAQLQQGVDVAALNNENQHLVREARQRELCRPGPSDGTGPTHVAWMEEWCSWRACPGVACLEESPPSCGWEKWRCAQR